MQNHQRSQSSYRDVGRFPAIATAARKAGICWLVDSGSESDLVSKSMLRDINAKNCRAAEHPISLITANGSTEANEVADVKLPALPYPVQPYVLDQTPAVLSVGNQVCRASENCHCIRATEKDDGTQISCRQRLASQVQDFRNDFDNGTLILYASLPCVGGSPWGNENGLTVEGQERIQEQ